RGLRWAGVLLAWAALTPSVGRTQTGTSEQASPWWQRWDSAPPPDWTPAGKGGLAAAFLPDDNLPPAVVRGQIDSAAGYAPPDPNLPSPLGSTRPESGFFTHGSFLLYEQTNPLRNQLVARRGFVDSDGLVTVTGVGTPVGSFAIALQTNQVRG